MSKEIEYINVKSMWDEAGYIDDNKFVSDTEIERVINILVDEINNLRKRIDELE
tara:strand:+ start:193 stop:354 length:162 start_codon:yes stop_codon:yes gene_type:complete